MRYPAPTWLPSRSLAAASWKSGAAAIALLAFAGTAQAQVAAPAEPAKADAEAEGPVAFEADGVSYDDAADSVTAFGNVFMRRGDQSIRADQVVWNRKTAEVQASGNVRLVDEDGNQLFADSLTLDDKLRAGAMQNMLLALREGGRLAAAKGSRAADGVSVLSKAVYSACAVENAAGCPAKPSWRITAERVSYDESKKLIRFKGARLEVFGARLLPLPGLMLTSDGRPISGLLVPDVRLSASNGVEFSQSYYKRLGDNRDMAITGYVYTAALPMVSGQYRQLTSKGAYQLTGYATRSSRIPIGSGQVESQRDFRGYLTGNARFQLSPNWSLTAVGRLASDRTFLRRYDISRDDRLRSMVELERIDPDSYLSIAGWATQTLRVGDPQGQVPIALPVIDYRRRLAEPVLGGRIELQANSMAITRTTGQDTQRAFAAAKWDLRRITDWGQELTFTALARGDVYNSNGNSLTATASYRGNPGWQTRGIATAAADVKWPLLGQLLGGTQVLTPRLQIVASPTLRNLAIPNEDARAIDLEDSNLFALNRFPGYDRIEDGVRFTYGFDWQWDRPGWRVATTIGQSYRLISKPTLLPDGTGLSSRSSDIVGRTEIRFKDFVRFTHRFRLDKDSLAVRRNEIDAAIGDERTYAEIGYLRLNRNISAIAEDLKDREELRASGRVAFARYWSVFGSGVFNLTGKNEDPALPTNSFQALRTRLGVAYQDDCLELAFTWRRDFVATGDARRGNTFQLSIAVRNLGFR